MEKLIRKFALQNAVFFEGRARAGAVIGKVLAQNPVLKKDMKEVSRKVAAVVAEVNKLSLQQQQAELGRLAPELLEKKKGGKRELPELRNAEKGKVVTRIPPEPSKYMHIGHALSFLINAIYAEKYGGKVIVRFEDTNPDTCAQEYVDAMIDDIRFLGIKAAPAYVSDDMPELLKKAAELVNRGKAYVCHCSREEMQEQRKKGKSCSCRKKLPQQNAGEWQQMQEGKYGEGTATLRFKGDMKSMNFVLRDPVLFRISNTGHYRHGTTYKVWPLYDFENAVEDGLQGITHIFRSIEFGGMRVELQNEIKKALKLPLQEVVQYGRFEVAGAVTQGREIRRLIEQGSMSGWDDPRLMTIRALRRRGIQPDTFRELAVEAGLSLTPTTLDWSLIAAVNRRIIDATARRYFFVEKPVKIRIENAPPQSLQLKEHPEKEKRARKFSTTDSFYIAAADLEQLGKLTRLMECLNFAKKGSGYVFDSLEHATFKDKGGSTIVWLPAAAKNIEVEVIMPDGKKVKGLAEENIAAVKPGDMVQFVRFGFCRLEAVEKDKRVFVYAHE